MKGPRSICLEGRLDNKKPSYARDAKAATADVKCPQEQNPGTYLSQYYYKPQMRHQYVAHATPMCRIVILTDFNKNDYEGE